MADLPNREKAAEHAKEMAQLPQFYVVLSIMKVQPPMHICRACMHARPAS